MLPLFWFSQDLILAWFLLLLMLVLASFFFGLFLLFKFDGSGLFWVDFNCGVDAFGPI